MGAGLAHLSFSGPVVRCLSLGIRMGCRGPARAFFPFVSALLIVPALAGACLQEVDCSLRAQLRTCPWLLSSVQGPGGTGGHWDLVQPFSWGLSRRGVHGPKGLVLQGDPLPYLASSLYLIN